MLVRLLGGIDIISSMTFLMLIFGITPPLQLLFFCAGLLLAKGFFVLTGDVLSVLDLCSALILLVRIFIALPILFLWLPAFFLLAKGVASLF